MIFYVFNFNHSFSFNIVYLISQIAHNFQPYYVIVRTHCPPPEGWWVGRAEKWRSPFLGVGLAMRCERSEHGKSQLFIKYFCTILPLVFYFCHSFFQISLSLSATLCLFASKSHCTSPLACNVPAAWRGGGFHYPSLQSNQRAKVVNIFLRKQCRHLAKPPVSRR